MNQPDTPDATIHNVDGTSHGNSTVAGGKVGSAQDFDGSRDYLVLGTKNDLNLDSDINFTAELWVKTTGWNDDAAMMANKDWKSGSYTGWAIAGGAGNNGSMQWNFCGKSGTRADYDPSDSVIHIKDGQWHYICVSHDRNGVATFFFDGVQKATVSLTGSAGSIDAGYPTVIGTGGVHPTGYGRYITILMILPDSAGLRQSGPMKTVTVWKTAGKLPILGIPLLQTETQTVTMTACGITVSMLPELTPLTLPHAWRWKLRRWLHMSGFRSDGTVFLTGLIQ